VGGGDDVRAGRFSLSMRSAEPPEREATNVVDEFGSDLLAGVERINRHLGGGLRLTLVWEILAGRGSRAAQEVQFSNNAYHFARLILTATDERGLPRQASRRLRLTPGRRSRLVLLSAGLAECAMDLGLGASVWSGRREST